MRPVLPSPELLPVVVRSSWDSGGHRLWSLKSVSKEDGKTTKLHSENKIVQRIEVCITLFVKDVDNSVVLISRLFINIINLKDELKTITSGSNGFTHYSILKPMQLVVAV